MKFQSLLGKIIARNKKENKMKESKSFQSLLGKIIGVRLLPGRVGIQVKVSIPLR